MLVWCKESKDQLKECFKAIASIGDKERSRKMRKNLLDKLIWLRDYACWTEDDKKDQAKTKCQMFTDFAPLSFAFSMQTRKPDGTYEYWFNGGLIFHGQHDGGGNGGAPTFSVCLEPTDGWSVHT